MPAARDPRNRPAWARADVGESSEGPLLWRWPRPPRPLALDGGPRRRPALSAALSPPLSLARPSTDCNNPGPRPPANCPPNQTLQPKYKQTGRRPPGRRPAPRRRRRARAGRRHRRRHARARARAAGARGRRHAAQHLLQQDALRRQGALRRALRRPESHGRHVPHHHRHRGQHPLLGGAVLRRDPPGDQDQQQGQGGQARRAALLDRLVALRRRVRRADGVAVRAPGDLLGRRAEQGGPGQGGHLQQLSGARRQGVRFFAFFGFAFLSVSRSFFFLLSSPPPPLFRPRPSAPAPPLSPLARLAHLPPNAFLSESTHHRPPTNKPTKQTNKKHQSKTKTKTKTTAAPRST